MAHRRDDQLRTLRGRSFDVVVIGGGITGAGIALDATARGLSVALLDKGDTASGTSGWSTKLVHGGIRYLEQFDVPMVREGVRERQILTRIAPYLVRRLPFLYPVENGLAGTAYVDAGLWLYDALAGWRTLGLHRRLGRAAAAAAAPLRETWNTGGFIYYDGQTDDTRLTLTILLTAVERGAVAATYTMVTGFLKDGGRLSGVRARDVLAGDEFTLRARAIINATGVWMGQVQRMDDPAAAMRVVPSKGSHIVVPLERLPLKTAVIMPRTSDGRVLFAVPWQGRVVVGTTDEEYHGDDLDHPVAGAAEVSYILAHVNTYFRADLRTDDIVATYAGLRPLIRAHGASVSGDQDPDGVGWPGAPAKTAAQARTKDISRQHVIVTSPSGLVSIGGGKLTTYRVMARDAVEAALRATGIDAPRRATTARLPLTGAAGYRQLRGQIRELGERYGVDAVAVHHLLHRYGSHAIAVLEILSERPDLAAPLVPGLPYLAVEPLYSARYELVGTLEDVLARRTRLLLLDSAHGRDVAEQVAALIAPELGWDEARVAAELVRYRDYSRLAGQGYGDGRDDDDGAGAGEQAAGYAATTV